MQRWREAKWCDLWQNTESQSLRKCRNSTDLAMCSEKRFLQRQNMCLKRLITRDDFLLQEYKLQAESGGFPEP